MFGDEGASLGPADFILIAIDDVLGRVSFIEWFDAGQVLDGGDASFMQVKFHWVRSLLELVFHVGDLDSKFLNLSIFLSIHVIKLTMLSTPVTDGLGGYGAVPFF